MKNYNNMSGGLFDGKPLEVVHDPSRDIRAQQIATSLMSIVTDRCAIPDEVWSGIWEKTGRDGELCDSWKEWMTDRARFAQQVAQAHMEKDLLGNEVEASGKAKAKVFNDELLAIARSVMA